MAQMNNALPALNAKDDKHNVFNDGKDRTIWYVEWKDEMKPCSGLQIPGTGTGRKQRALLAAERPRQELARTHLGELPHY